MGSLGPPPCRLKACSIGGILGSANQQKSRERRRLGNFESVEVNPLSARAGEAVENRPGQHSERESRSEAMPKTRSDLTEGDEDETETDDGPIADVIWFLPVPHFP